MSAGKESKLFYGYIVAMAGFCIMAVVHGLYSSFGVFFPSLLAEFGWSRATLAGASSIAFFTMGCVGIIMGVLTDRFGPRLVMTASGIFFGIGHLLMSQVHAVWQMYLFYIIIGIGLSTGDLVPLTTIARWFVKKRATMSGIMKIGTGLGMMAMPLVINGLINAFDWRFSYTVLGILVFVTVIPLAQLLRRDPGQMSLLPDGEKRLATDSLNRSEVGLSLPEAIRTRQLWMVCAMYLSLLFCAQAVIVHIVPHAVDMGISMTKAAGIASILGGTSMVGRLTMGITGDRIGNKKGIVICFLILITTLAWLQLASESWMLYLFAAVYGFAHGGFFALISPMVAGLFGTRSQGLLLGIVIFCGTIGGSTGPYLTGAIFDMTGSYQLAFFILFILAIIGTILMVLVKPIVKEGHELSLK